MHWGLRVGDVAGWVDGDGGGGGAGVGGPEVRISLFAVIDRFCRQALFGARGREREGERGRERERLGRIGAGWGNVVVSFWRADELGFAR